MEQLLPLTTVNVFEYLLLVEPNEDVKERILNIKHNFFERYQAPESIRGKPHLTLVNFVQHAGFEERILHRLRSVALSQKPFQIELMDYGSFPSHTIYINVLSRLPFQNLVKEIRSETQPLLKLNRDYTPRFILEPHLTVARKLKPWQYEEGWLEYSNKFFSAKFITGSMSLMKRPIDGSKYKVMERFDFLDLPGPPKQCSLF